MRSIVKEANNPTESFAVIYRLRLKKARVKRYQVLWNELVDYFKSECGAVGSCLHQAEDGMWVAYSRWPDQATRDKAWPKDKPPSQYLPKRIQAIILEMKSCSDQRYRFDPIEMTVVNDKLI